MMKTDPKYLKYDPFTNVVVGRMKNWKPPKKAWDILEQKSAGHYYLRLPQFLSCQLRDLI